MTYALPWLASPLILIWPLQLAAYNPEAVVFSFFGGTFTWMDSGEIQMDYNIMVSRLKKCVCDPGP